MIQNQETEASKTPAIRLSQTCTEKKHTYLWGGLYQTAQITASLNTAGQRTVRQSLHTKAGHRPYSITVKTHSAQASCKR